jgi:hypothetical protein
MAKKNYAYYIERLCVDDIKRLKGEHNSIPYKERRRVKGPVTDVYAKFIDSVCNSGTMIDTDVANLKDERSEADGGNDGNVLTNQTRLNIMAYLDSKYKLLSLCDIFVIEQQYLSVFGKGKKARVNANVQCMKIGELTLTWLLQRFPKAEYCVFNATYKTQLLGAPDKLTDHKRKKWAVEKAIAIYTRRDDKKALDRYECKRKEKQKLDDMSDALIQCQAYKLRSLVCEF